jgi:hypothetical protein
MIKMQKIEAGKKVVCDYRKQRYTGEPLTGMVLEKNDVRAWAGTMAFGYRQDPSQEEVDKHIKRCKEIDFEIGLKSDERFPVLWEFGKIYWEETDNLHVIGDQ